MWDRFGDTGSVNVASNMLYALLMTPDVPADRQRLRELAELGSRAFAGNQRLLGAAQFRLGEAEAALSSFAEASGKFAPRGWDLCIQAMCQLTLDRREPAERLVEQCDQWIGQANESLARPASVAGTGVRWFNWQERAEVLHLRQELAAMLQAAR